MNKFVISSLLLMTLASPLWADEYQLDPTHSFVEWRVQHLGYSWLYGRFNTMTGNFNWDPENTAASSITVEIQTSSLDSNHAERDKHLRGEKFLDVKNYPQAGFVSTGFKGNADGGTLSGNFTLHGITNPIEFEIKRMGQGSDPWGGYRAGFIATTVIDRRDYGIAENLGPVSNIVELELGIEGIRTKPGH